MIKILPQNTSVLFKTYFEIEFIFLFKKWADLNEMWNWERW